MDKPSDPTSPNGSVNSTYDAQDRLISRGSITYGYTPNGELRSKISGSDTTKYGYDATGNVVSVILPTGTSIQYVLDATGRRVGRKVNGVLIQGFLYGVAGGPVAELDGQNNVLTRFEYGIGSAVPSYMVRNGVTYALITDHVGSVRLVVDAATGSVVQRVDYDAWGRVTQNTNPGFQPFGFAGGLYDEAADLVGFGRRTYDPDVGRWITKDPVLFDGGANLYRYAGDDPINFTDPSGLWPEHGALNAGAQFAAGYGDFVTSGFGLGHALGLPSLTEMLRQAYDYDDIVDRCSLWYQSGEAAAMLTGTALSAALEAEAASARAARELEKAMEHLPPGWTEEWEWRSPANRGTSPRWFDPNGGEWHLQILDKWHTELHWDYNPWTEWNSAWRNVPLSGSN